MVRVFAVVMGNLIAVRPYADRRAGGVAIGAKLVFAVFELRLFQFNDNVGVVGAILVEDDNIGFFLFPAEADGIFKGQSFPGIAVLLNQSIRVKLADDFFGF